MKTPVTEQELVEFLDMIFGDLKAEDKTEEIQSEEDEDVLLRGFEFEIPEPPILRRTSAEDYGYQWFFTPTARAMSVMEDRMGKPQTIKRMNFPAFTETKRKAPSVSVIGPHSDLMSTPPGYVGIVKIREGICVFKTHSSERPIKKRRFCLLDEDNGETDFCRKTLFRDE